MRALPTAGLPATPWSSASGGQRWNCEIEHEECHRLAGLFAEKSCPGHAIAEKRDGADRQDDFEGPAHGSGLRSWAGKGVEGRKTATGSSYRCTTTF